MNLEVPALVSFLAQILVLALAVAGLVAFGLLIWKRGVFTVQAEAIKTLNDAYSGLELRFNEEVECRKKLERKVNELEVANAKLEGISRGKSHTIEEMYRAAVNSGGCELAFDGRCDKRQVPGQAAFDAVVTPET